MTESRLDIRKNDDEISLEKLPSDVLTRICDFLAPYIIFNSFKLTCKPFYNVTTTTEFNQHQYMHYFTVSPSELSNNYSFWFKVFRSYQRHDQKTKGIVACITEDLQTFMALIADDTRPGLDIFLSLHPTSEYNDGVIKGRYFYYFLIKTNRTVCLNYLADNMLSFHNDKNSAFIIAARFGRLDIIKRMLAQDETLLNITDSDNCTALMWASHHDYVDIVQFLLANNPNLQIRTNSAYLIWDQDALDRAIVGRATKVIPLLLKEYAAKLPNEDHAILNPLSYAVKKNWPDVVEVLLAYHNQFAFKKLIQEENLLFPAVKYGHVDVVKVLLKHAPFLLQSESKANIYCLLDRALSSKQEAIFQVLIEYLLYKQKEEIYHHFLEQQLLLRHSINFKLKSIKASQQNFIFIAASRYELEHLKLNINTLSRNEHLISNTIKILKEIVNIYNKFCNLPRTKDFSKFLFSLIDDALLNIFGHSNYIHCQDSDRKLTLSIPNCYYLFWKDIENHILSCKQHLGR